jgi:hypothetical protein
VNKNPMDKIKRSILISIPILFIISGPLHFLFELTGEPAIIGAVVPVSESPWEHLKLVFYPIMVWWIIFYFKARKQDNFSEEKWMVSTAAAVLSSVLTIVCFFYFYTGAFAVEFLALDIFSSLLAVAVGQLLAYHIYKYSKPWKAASIMSLMIVIAMLIMFVVFTYKAPNVPLFRDKNTGSYGI